jgi:uncharacterized protein YndB with AHSA1/START domain
MKRELVELEFFFKASLSMVFEYVSSEEGLIRWFCDEIMVRDEIYEFYWNDSSERARIVEFDDEKRIVFRWEDADDPEEYLKFEVYKSPVTNETIFKVSEFCDSDEVEDTIELWESQVGELMKLLGS